MVESSRAAGLGERFSPIGAHLQDPYPFFAEARRSEPVFYSPQLDYWFVTRYDDIVSIVRDTATFSSKDTIPQHDHLPPEVMEVLADYRRTTVHLINTDPPQHSRLRTIMNQGFSPSAIATLEPSIREVANGLIDEFVDAGAADLNAQLGYPMALTVILRLLGVPPEDLEQCGAWAEELATLSWGWASASTEQLVECAKSVVAFQRYTEELVSERHRHPADDLISRVLHAGIRDHAALTEDEVVLMVPGLIVAGHETTANLLGNTLFLLLSHADALAELSADPSLLERVVEEGARCDASLFGSPRTAMTDVEIAGVQIPAGARLFLLFTAANHDEEKYADPESFCPSRQGEVQNLAFGRGVHHCIGAPLGRMETRVGLELVLDRLPNVRLATTEITRRPSFLFRGHERLDVVWDVPQSAESSS